MDLVTRSAQKGDAHAQYAAGSLLHTMSRWFARSPGAMLNYVIEYRRAKAAAELHTQLSRLSDAELARRDLTRDQLAQHIRERRYI
jgi:hypothetical protein